MKIESSRHLSQAELILTTQVLRCDLQSRSCPRRLDLLTNTTVTTIIFPLVSPDARAQAFGDIVMRLLSNTTLWSPHTIQYRAVLGLRICSLPPLCPAMPSPKPSPREPHAAHLPQHAAMCSALQAQRCCLRQELHLTLDLSVRHQANMYTVGTRARCSARSPFCSGYVAFPRGLSPVLPVATICIFSRVRPPVCQVKVMTGGSSSHTLRHTKLVTSIRCRWPGQLHRLADPWITSLHLCHIERPIGSGGPRLNDLRYIGWCPGRIPSLVRCFLSVILPTTLYR